MFDSSTELVNFDRNVGLTGWRLDSTQELSLRFARAGMFLTPAIALRQTNYWIDNPAPGEDDSLTRGLPDREPRHGAQIRARHHARPPPWVQTLEPRLLYVRVPYEDQSQLPVFDTILPDFNLIQLFRKYQFVGPDRIADTDQLSFGVHAAAHRCGQRPRARATGPDALSKPAARDPARHAADRQPRPRITWPRSPSECATPGRSTSVINGTAKRHRPRAQRPGSSSALQDDRLFGIGYRYRRGALEQGDVSLVWPIAQRWRMIGRYSYSFLDKERLEDFFGFEYEACCWRLRLVNPQLREPAHGRDRQLDLVAARAEGLVEPRHRAGRPTRPWYSGLPQHRPGLLRRAIP